MEPQDTGQRKYALASLLIGAAIASGQWYIAIGAFVVYFLANLWEKRDAP